MRLRKETHQSPEVVRELAALDAALSGDPVDPDLADLEELVVALRAERPTPAESFEARLDALVRDSFRPVEVRDRRQETSDDRSGLVLARRGRPRQFWNRASLAQRRVPLAFGAAASVLIGLTVVLSSGVLSPGGDGGQSEERPGRPVFEEQSRGREPAPSARPSRPGASDAIMSPGPVPPTGIAPRARERRVERQASLRLAAPPGKVEDVADGVVRVTDRYRGFVLSSSVSGGSDGREGATFELRIPASRLLAAIADLSRLAHVRSRTQSAFDVTGTYTSARSRLREALAERRGLLRQLATADTPNETASIRSRLRLANRRIGRARAALRDLATRVRYAAVSVTVEAARERGQSGDWTLGEALDDAFGILRTALAVALVSLAVLLPIMLLVVLAWLGGGRIVRERRERALDQAAGIEKRPLR